MENSVIMVNRVRFRSPQNVSGASQQNRVEAFSYTTEADGDLFLKNIKTQLTKKYK